MNSPPSISEYLPDSAVVVLDISVPTNFPSKSFDLYSFNNTFIPLTP